MRSGYFYNSLRESKKSLERKQKAARVRLAALRGQNHPVADDQDALIKIRDGWIKELDQLLSERADIQIAGAK